MFFELLSGLGPGNIVIVTETLGHWQCYVLVWLGTSLYLLKPLGSPGHVQCINLCSLPPQRKDQFEYLQLQYDPVCHRHSNSEDISFLFFHIKSVKCIWGPHQAGGQDPLPSYSNATLFLHYEELNSQFNLTSYKLIQQTKYYLVYLDLNMSQFLS